MSPDSMRMLMQPFFRKTLLTALIFLIIYYAITYYFSSHFFSKATPWLTLFFLAVYNFLHFRHLKSMQKKTTRFITNFIFSSGFKLIVFLFVILGYSMLFRDDAINFILTFFVLYLLFTLVELLHLKRGLKT